MTLPVERTHPEDLIVS